MSKSIIQLGGTGDLAKKKLLPAYRKLYEKGIKFKLLSLGRRFETRNDYLNHMVEDKNNYPFLDYAKVDIKNKLNMNSVIDFIKKNKSSEVIFYFALLPELYFESLEFIKYVLKNVNIKTKKIVVEKPFGFDYESSIKYSDMLKKIFTEEEIYRVDHYLGKEFIQNLLIIRFHNDMIQGIWNKNYIDHIEIVIDESVGVNQRLEFYDKTGVVRDMFQNHILQIVSLLTMAEPVEYTQKSISEEKQKILKSIRKIDDFEFGAYSSFKSKNSATFVVAKLFVDTFDFAGIPFYIRTGKMLGNSKSKIYIEFKDFKSKSENLVDISSNSFVIEIQPNMTIDFNLNIKKPHTTWGTKQVKLNFSHYDTFKINTPEAYEQIIERIFASDKTTFPCSREIDEAWKVVQPMLESKKKIIRYDDGQIPPFAHNFLKKNNLSWNI